MSKNTNFKFTKLILAHNSIEPQKMTIPYSTQIHREKGLFFVDKGPDINNYLVHVLHYDVSVLSLTQPYTQQGDDVPVLVRSQGFHFLFDGL